MVGTSASAFRFTVFPFSSRSVTSEGMRAPSFSSSAISALVVAVSWAWRGEEIARNRISRKTGVLTVHLTGGSADSGRQEEHNANSREKQAGRAPLFRLVLPRFVGYYGNDPMNLLLISTNRNALPMPVMPIGVCMVADACERAGHCVTLLDLMFEREPLHVVREAVMTIKPDVV